MSLLLDEWVSEHVKAVQELEEDTGNPGMYTSKSMNTHSVMITSTSSSLYLDLDTFMY